MCSTKRDEKQIDSAALTVEFHSDKATKPFTTQKWQRTWLWHSSSWF